MHRFSQYSTYNSEGINLTNGSGKYFLTKFAEAAEAKFETLPAEKQAESNTFLR